MKHPKEQSVSFLHTASRRFYMTLETDGMLAEMFAISAMVYCQRNSLSIAHLHNREPIRMVGHSTESSTDQPVFFNNPPPPLPGVASPKAGFVNIVCLKSTPEWSIFENEDLWQVMAFPSPQCRLEKVLHLHLFKPLFSSFSIQMSSPQSTWPFNYHCQRPWVSQPPLKVFIFYTCCVEGI